MRFRSGPRPLAATLLLALSLAGALAAMAAEPEFTTLPPARSLSREELRALPTEQFERVFKTVHPQEHAGEAPEEGTWIPPEPTDTPAARRAFDYGPRMTTDFEGHLKHGSPADPHIAAGPDHLVSVVNVQIAFWTKDGTNLQTTHLNTFFGVPSGQPGIFDPKVIYDKDSGRFFVMALSVNCTAGISRYHVAASKTSDPTDGFWVYAGASNLTSNHWVDYPTLGVGEGALYVGGNFIACDGFPDTLGSSMWIMDKSALISGAGVPTWKYADGFPVPVGGNILTQKAAVTWDSPPGIDNFIVAWNGLPGVTFQPAVWAVSLPPDFPASPPSATLSLAPDSWSTVSVEDAAQAGGPASVKANNLGSNLMNAVYRNGVLYTACNWGGTGPSWLRTVALDVASWPTVSVQSTSVYGNGTDYYYWPAIAGNAFGDVVTVFSRSGASEFVGGRWTMRLRHESAWSNSQFLKSGEAYYGEPSDDSSAVYRWGDYGGACVDPVSEGFWIMHKYAAPLNTGLNPQRNWRTWIGHIPRPVFVDAAHLGVESGSRPNPYQTVSFGYLAALPGNDLVIRTGSYDEALSLAKPLSIIADGGPVTIGR